MLTRTLFILLSFLFISPDVFATAPLESTCEVVGTIQEIRFQEEWCNSCMLNAPCPTDTPLFRSAGYWVKIKIDHVVPIEKGHWNIPCIFRKNCELSELTELCNTFYPVGSLQKIFIDKGEKDAQPYMQTGRVIREKVRSDFEKYFEFNDDSSTKKMKELPACYKAYIEQKNRTEKGRE